MRKGTYLGGNLLGVGECSGILGLSESVDGGYVTAVKRSRFSGGQYSKNGESLSGRGCSTRRDETLRSPDPNKYISYRINGDSIRAAGCTESPCCYNRVDSLITSARGT